jgi:hypothetical protein
VSIEFDLLSADQDAFEAALLSAVRSGALGERRLLDVLPLASDEY